MKETVYSNDFRDAFRRMDRKENFSYEGLDILYNYLCDLEDDSGTEIELDVIALCCDYNEDHFEDIINNYDIDIKDCETEEDKIQSVREYLEENTMVVGETSDSFIYQVF